MMLILVFRDSTIIRDLRWRYSKSTRPPSRTPIILKKSLPTAPYEFNYSEPQNFSQPRDGKLTQYDFNLSALSHHPSKYYSSTAFLANKKIKKPINDEQWLINNEQILADSSIVENHRFYYLSKTPNQKNQKQKSPKLPSNQDIYKSAVQFNDKKSSTALSHIFSSAENPYVLPAIVKKRDVSEVVKPAVSSKPSGTTFHIPSAPQSSKTEKTTFSFNFTKSKS